MEDLCVCGKERQQKGIPVVLVPAPGGRKSPEELAEKLVETVVREEFLGKKSR